LLVVAVYFLPSTASAVESWVHPRQPAPLVWSESAFAVTVAGWCALGVYLIARSGLPPAVFGLTRPRVSDLVFGGVLSGFLLVLAGVAVHMAPPGLFGPWDVSPEPAWLTPRTPIEWTLVIVANCLNGFAEEVMVRSFFQTRLEHLTRAPVWSVVAAALLFTAYHAYQGPAAMLTVFVIGLALGTFFRLFRRLWVVAVAHAAYNVLLVSLFTDG
jgi:membrane protease YdiL (CAAX protease family)